MTAREDTIERIERVLNLTHKDSITVTIPRLTAERAVSLLKEQEPKPVGKEWNECPNCEYKNCIGAQGTNRNRRNRKTGKKQKNNTVPEWCPLKEEEAEKRN